MTKASAKVRLIETASRLFYQQGFNRTGINQILDESGVAKASMYQHFRSKDEICVAYLQQMDEDVTRALQDYLGDLEGPDKIMGLMEFLEIFFNQDGFRGCWCLNTLSEIPRDNTLIMKEILGQKRALRAFIRQLVKDNLQVENPDSLGDKLYLLYEAALVEAQLFMQDWPINRAKAMYRELIEAAE